MRNAAILKSSEKVGNGLVRPGEFEPYVRYLVEQVQSGLIDTIVVEGRPGAGKTALASMIAFALTLRGIPNFT